MLLQEGFQIMHSRQLQYSMAAVRLVTFGERDNSEVNFNAREFDEEGSYSISLGLYTTLYLLARGDWRTSAVARSASGIIWRRLVRHYEHHHEPHNYHRNRIGQSYVH